MQCDECGASLPDDEGCLERFHALLAAEVYNAELARMHGLTVLTYYTQHPSRAKPWLQVANYAVLRRAFGEGRDWLATLREGNTHANVARLKATVGPIMPPWVVTAPVAGELTAADVDPAAPSGQAEQVLAWARSVAERRVLPSAMPQVEGSGTAGRPGGGRAARRGR
jgi:hypothetical protein